MGEKGEVSLGFRAFLFGVEILILALILGGAWVIDKTLLAPPIILSFRLSRVKIETKYDILHMASILGCMFVSTTICLFGLFLSLPVNVSFISSIVIGVGFAIITWNIQDLINLKAKYDEINKELETLKNALESDKGFDVDKCTQEQLIARCNELSMSQDAIEFAIELFIKKTKQSVLADKMCVEEKSIQQHKRRLRKKLNKLS
jgi:hypothetical protein